jgi:uncharacterized protein (DUF1800 family)
MVKNRPSKLWYSSLVLIATTILAIPAIAQSDPDPNSPAPVLLMQKDAKRVLAMQVPRFGAADPAGVSVEAFEPGTDIVVFATNLALMDSEGANAFRVNVTDANGRNYRFPVIDINPVETKGHEGIYALTVRLKDDLGLWRQPILRGDVLIGLTWRGLESDRLRLGYGNTGGKIKDPEPKAATKAGSDGPTSEYVAYRWSGDRMRFLEQAGFGGNQMLDQRVRRIGVRSYLAEQFEQPYPSVGNAYPDIPLKSTNTEDVALGCGPAPNPRTPVYNACIRDHYSMYPVQKWFFTDALYGESQLRHKAAWSLSQIWVISGSGGVTQQSSWMIAYHKILSQHAFGNYRNLMKDMTLNPGMGNYLDMVRSTKNNPNENYPREILQLFTIGLFMLNQDGTLMLDNDGDPIPTYDQTTVDNFTKVFTGWGFCTTGCPNSAPSILNYKDPMILNQANHNVTTKTLLSYPNAVNQNIAANLNGNVELDLALDNIFNHPNVGPFVSKLLIQQMVTSDPTPAYVSRVSAKFNDNGAGVRGDMKTVIRAILLDPEARGDVKTDPNFGKLREPVSFATNILRALNVKNVALTGPSDGVVTNYTNGIGQNPFNSPTVFNYYPPDFVVPGTSLLGPEFGILTTGTAVGRANVVNTMTFGQIAVAENSPAGTKIDITDLQALATADPTGNLVLDALNQRMLHNTMSPQMRATILPAFTAVAANNPLARAQAAVYLVASSSQFQVQR